MHTVRELWPESMGVGEWTGERARRLNVSNTLFKKAEMTAANNKRALTLSSQVLASIHDQYIHAKHPPEEEMSLCKIHSGLCVYLCHGSQQRLEERAVFV